MTVTYYYGQYQFTVAVGQAEINAEEVDCCFAVAVTILPLHNILNLLDCGDHVCSGCQH